MSIINKLKWMTVGVAILALSSVAVAQDPNARVTIGSGGGQAGGQVTVDWGYENFDNEVSSYSYVIEFDQTSLEPDVTGGNRDVVGCLDNIPADWSGPGTTCRNVDGSGEIVVVIAEQSGNAFGDFEIFPTTQPVGFMTFTIDPTAAVGTIFPLEGVLTTATDSSINDVSADFEIVDGQIEVLDVTAILNVQPDTLNFGSQQTGSTSSPQSVTVSNDGTDGVDLEITGINVTGEFDDAGGTCTVGTTLADTDTCTIDVTFSPATDGVKAGTLVVTSDAGEVTNDTVDLNGEGIPTDAELTIDPAAFDFGPLDIEDAAECTNFTLANTAGTDSLTIGAASVAAPFTVTGNCDGATLGGGESCVVEVCFDPNAEGTFAETLSVTSDVNDVTATVEGEGTSEADVTVDPPFGPVDLGVGAPGELITANGSANNSGSADADLSCTLTGDTAVISTDPDPLAGTVPAGGSLPFSISCALPETGEEGDEFSATLSCDVDQEFAGEHVITCGISTFEPLPVPTMQAWALALFALLMLLAGGIGIRYFRTN